MAVAVVLPPGATEGGAGIVTNTGATVTVAVAVPAAYTGSPGYEAVSVLAPLLKVPAGRVNEAVPLESGCQVEYEPVARLTEPEGVAPPAAPLTVMETVNGCPAATVVAAGFTVTVDAVEPGAVTVTTRTAEVDCALFVSPAYLTMIELAPNARVLVVKVALLLLLRVAVPKTALPA